MIRLMLILVFICIQKAPSIDLIMAVENSRKFHEQNILKNKDHYTFFARSTKYKVVHKIQEFGARMHFNTTTLQNAELVKDLSDGEQDSIKIRYGVIELDDLLRDLKLWETLLTSSFMQRPHEVLETGQNYDKIIEMQRKNLTSAVSRFFNFLSLSHLSFIFSQPTQQCRLPTEQMNTSYIRQQLRFHTTSKRKSHTCSIRKMKKWSLMIASKGFKVCTNHWLKITLKMSLKFEMANFSLIARIRQHRSYFIWPLTTIYTRIQMDFR